MKEENNIPQSQEGVHIEASNKKILKNKYLIKGIILSLCSFVFFVLCMLENYFYSEIEEIEEYVELSDIPPLGIFIVIPIVTFVFSLVLLALPRLRKNCFIIPYLGVNLLSIGCCLINCFRFGLALGCMGTLFIIPATVVLIISCIFTFVSIIIKDEKE